MSLTKLKHRIGSGLRISSFVICILLSLLWVRSCTTSDLITLTTRDHYYELATIPASIRFAVSESFSKPKELTWIASDIMPKPGVPQPVFGRQSISRNWYYFGVGIKRSTVLYSNRSSPRVANPFTLISIPIQLLAFIFFLPVAWRIATIGHRRRLRAALIAQQKCPRCGYDLRATPERCPECGDAVIQRSAEQQRAAV